MQRNDQTSDHNERSRISYPLLLKISGFALIAALLLQVVGFGIHPASEAIDDVRKSTYAPAHLVLWGSWLLATLGLAGMYARQAPRGGLLGVIAFVAVIFAAAYHLYLLLYEAYATTLLATDATTQHLIADGPLAHGAGALGPFGFASVLAFPLFGIATWRAGIFSPWAAWLQIAAVPVMFLGSLVVPPDSPAPLGTLATAPISWLYFLFFAGLARAGYALAVGIGDERAVSDQATPQLRATHGF